MKKDNQAQTETGINDSSPRKLHLPGFISESEVGLGTVIKRVTSAVGIAPCTSCEQRAATLNRWLVFTSNQSK